MTYRGHVVAFCNPDCRDKFRKATHVFDSHIARASHWIRATLDQAATGSSAAQTLSKLPLNGEVGGDSVSNDDGQVRSMLRFLTAATERERNAIARLADSLAARDTSNFLRESCEAVAGG